MEALIIAATFNYGVGVIGWIIIGGLAGAVAGRIVQGGGFGILGDIIVGIVGAFIGGIILSFFSIGGGGGDNSSHYILAFITALIGAVVLLYIVRAVTGSSRGNRARL